MNKPKQINPILRVAIVVVALGACFWAIWFTARLSFARILVRYGMGLRNVAALDKSVRLGSQDAEAHFARAAVSKAVGLPSVTDFERAVSLRPRDYYLWMELGIARDEANDPAGALVALNESVRLAPYYARPLWQRGNVLLRMKRFDEAFADLRSAAKSDPELLPNLIDLSWNLAQFDVARAETLAQINTPQHHAAFATYLARRNRPVEALAQLKLAGPTNDTAKKEIIAQLIATNSFAEAYEIWRGAGMESTGFYDGGFESALSLEESGFGWRVSRYLQGASLSLDLNEPQSGAQSLRIEFTGESAPEQLVLSQFVVVQPSMTYRVYFSAKTKDLVSGGPPLIRVIEPDSKRTILGESGPINERSTGWTPVTFTFKTGPTTKAVTIVLQRLGCSTGPCPAFGVLWLDSFSLARSK